MCHCHLNGCGLNALLYSNGQANFITFRTSRHSVIVYQPFHYCGDVSEGVLSVVAQFHIIYSSSQQG